MRAFAQFHGQRAEGGRRDTALRGGLVSRGDLQQDVFFAGLGAEGQREGQAGRRRSGEDVARDRDVARAVGAQRQDRVVDGGHISGRYQHLGQAGVRALERFEAQVVAATERVMSAAGNGA